MHILIFPSWYKTTENPVLGSFFEEQARGLMSAGHTVGIIYPRFLSFSSREKISHETVLDNGIHTYYCGYKCFIPRNYNINYYFFEKSVFKTYLKYVKENGVPDIIHGHTIFYAGIAAAYIARKAQVPFVITEHYTPFITGGIYHKADIDKAKSVFMSSDINLVVSNGFKKLLANKLQMPENTFNVLPNMVEDGFLNRKIDKIIDRKKPVFFTMSFLTERKNHRLMLDAFKHVLKQIPSAVFNIGGDGDIKHELIEYSKKLNIINNVCFLGKLSRNEVIEHMSNCDVFLLASKFETFGVVIIEALALGKPVITTDSIGPRDIINSENGILLSDSTPQTFGNAMVDVINNYENYDAESIRNYCKSKFSKSVVIKKLEDTYRELLMD